MTDDQQRAMELICQFCDMDPDDYYDEMHVTGAEAVEAITAALRAAPEVDDSYVVLQRVDVKRLLAGPVPGPSYELSRRRIMVCLTARPQGVKDAN